MHEYDVWLCCILKSLATKKIRAHLESMRQTVTAVLICIAAFGASPSATMASDTGRMAPKTLSPGIEIPNLPVEEVAAIRNVILGQLNAFKQDDAEKAFSFAAPEIRRIFKSPQIFLHMVRKSYQAVYRPRSFEFRKMQRIEGQIVQPLAVVGPSGVKETALYVMEKQADGIWKIGACIMASEPGTDT